jgi:hypothetical protein
VCISLILELLEVLSLAAVFKAAAAVVVVVAAAAEVVALLVVEGGVDAEGVPRCQIEESAAPTAIPPIAVVNSKKLALEVEEVIFLFDIPRFGLYSEGG